MIRIRAEQVQAMASAREAEFVARLASAVRKHFPAVGAASDKQALEAKIRSVLVQVRTAGVTSERDCMRLVNVAAALEWRPDEHPWFGALLSDPAVDDVSERVRRVVARALREKQREEQNRAARQQLERTAR